MMLSLNLLRSQMLLSDQCSYTNESEKGLKQHQRMKHKISQTDEANIYLEDKISQIDRELDDESDEEEAQINVLFRNQLKQVKPEKVKNMSKQELVDLNVQISKYLMIKMLELQLFHSNIQASNIQATVNNVMKNYMKAS